MCQTTEDAIKKILVHIGEDPEREGLQETPARIVKSYEELFSGYKTDPESLIKTFENEGYEEMILVRNIDYVSMCEHHMMPFLGQVHIAYIPDKKITGLSKLPRLVDCFAKRLQNQERMTVQIAETLFNELKPKGVAVQITGKHLCMCARGVNKVNSDTVTSTFLGAFQDDPSQKSCFLSSIPA
mgnify:CR=1 FL=1